MPIKRLTKRPHSYAKTPDQKTTTHLQALYSKAFSQLLPRYSQPAPQQTGTSQNLGKTTICSGFMSRFESLDNLFSTISSRPPQNLVGASLLAMNVNENANILNKRAALKTFASRLAPTRDCGELEV
jgi:hypothetical protein